MNFKEWLWDHIPPEQKKKMADMLSQGSPSKINFVDYFLSIRSGQFVELMSKKPIPSLFSSFEKANELSDKGFLKIQFQIGDDSLAAYLTDIEENKRIKLPDNVARSAAEEMIVHRS